MPFKKLFNSREVFFPEVSVSYISVSYIQKTMSRQRSDSSSRGKSAVNRSTIVVPSRESWFRSWLTQNGMERWPASKFFCVDHIALVWVNSVRLKIEVSWKYWYPFNIGLLAESRKICVFLISYFFFVELTFGLCSFQQTQRPIKLWETNIMLFGEIGLLANLG